MSRLTQLTSLLSLASACLAQIPSIIPFQVTGSLDGCSAGTEFNAGGTISVNEFSITVPKNLIVQFPTVYTPFPKLCSAGAGGFETTVVGNIINGRPIAGQIQVAARFGLEGSQGYISAINDGVLQIAGGPRVRINDPEGAFAPKVSQQPYFVMDTQNPSVSSFSGFPMCIQHAGNADTCKDSNRPAGQTNFDAPDPLTMVPFKVGDFIEYSGLRNNGEILAQTVTAINVQVTTKASDTVPNYIRVEDMLVGVQDTAANVEVADIRVIGFLSSCLGAVVTISAIDVDPCTGTESYRRIGSATPRQETRCKWEARIATTAPYTRDYLITTNTPVTETKNGIRAGQFVQAVGEWIFPEVDIPGTNPPPLIFNDIQGLVQGDFLDSQQFGQLSPFPGANPPAPKKQCSASDIPANNPTTPSTDNPSTSPNSPQTLPVAAAAQFAAVQRVGALLSLAGSNTAQGLNDDALNFAWTQTAPSTPAISIANPSQATATFTAPKVTTETTFSFTLTVSLKSNATASSKIVVPVKISPTAADVVTIDTYTWESRQSGSISVSCSSNVRDGDNKKMTLLINGVSNIPMAISGGNGRWAYTARSTARPNRLQCVSDLGGKSAERTGTQTTRRRKRGVLGLF
ncbi:uncharacterized protein M421DRAFT_415555 [Didymella exigua CBS 183.55]|uniref:Uncharacterized protein n=1 Tax=Didymella exigua CBS 183.55 TaxID=1150837 RepID=A0A6A5S171_9PLEO|nr:uncharacterized protein M421DRAFT_415555 [Didymella exigua CBS 183.55]KAF1933194.1 hypothetical protein M421DRAFT_415555 [Didymella exigua CBS 183.55]